MAEKAIFEIVVTEKGLRVNKKNIEDLGNEVQKTAKKQKDAAKANDELNYKLNQGTTGASSAARSFSKLNQAIGAGPNGLVGAYATLAANAFAVSAAFNALRNAQQAEMVLKGLEVQGARTGRSLTVAAERLREVVGFGIDAQEAMQATALFTSAGFNTKELERLGKVAQNTSLALGRNLPDSLDRLIKGTTKLEPELLDELGIMTKLTDATSTYALQNNKNADSLSAFQKRQAFLNAVLAEGELKFGGLNDQIETNPYDKLAASFSNLSKNSLSFVNDTLGVADAVEFLSESSYALTGVLLLFASTIQKTLLGSLSDLSKKSLQAATASREEAKAIREKINAKLAETRANVSAELAAQRALDINKKSPKAIKDISEAIKTGTASQNEFQRAIEASGRSIATHIRLREKEASIGKDTAPRTALIKQLEQQQQALLKLSVAEQEQATKIIPLELEARRQRLVQSAKTMQARAQESAASAIQAASEKQLSLAMQGTIVATKQYALSLALLRKEQIEAAAATGGLSRVTLAFNTTVNVVKTSLFGLNVAVRAVGAAILSLIGTIGMVLLVFGALKELYDYLYKKAYPNTAKANEELTAAYEETSKVLKTQNDALAEQKRIMASSGPIGDKVLMSWTSQANAAIELASSLDKLVAAQKARREAERLDALESSRSSGVDRSAGAKKFGIEETSAAFSILPSVIQDATAGIEQFFDASNEQTTLVKTVDIMAKNMGRTGLTAAIKDATGGLEKFQKMSSDQQAEVLAKILEENASKAVRMSAAIEQLNAALSEGATEASKFFKAAVPQTPFDGVVSAFEKLNSSLKTFKQEGKSARETLAVISKLSPELQNFLSPKDSALLNQVKEAEATISVLGSKTGKLSETELKRLNTARQLVNNSSQNLVIIENSLNKAEEENKLRQAMIALSKGMAAVEQARLGRISEYLNSGAAGMRAQLEAQNRINELNMMGARIQKSILDSMIAQKQAIIDSQKVERDKLALKREQLLEEQKITLEIYKRNRAQIIAAQQSIGVLRPGATVDNTGANKTVEEINRQIKEADAAIKAGEASLRTQRFQSKAIGLELVASQQQIFTSQEKAAKAALAAAEQLVKKTQDRLAVEKLIVEEKNLDTQLKSAAKGNVIQGNTVNSGSPVMRNTFDTEAEILSRNFEYARKSLMEQYAADTELLNKKLNDAIVAQTRARTDSEKKGIQETINKTIEDITLNGKRVEIQDSILEKEYKLNILKALGISDTRSELQLRQEILQTAQKELDTRQELGRVKFEKETTRRSTFADVVGTNIQNEATRQAEFAYKQAKESAELRKKSVEMEYTLLEAQRQLLEDKLRSGATELRKTGDIAGAANAEELANSVAANKATLAAAKANSIGLVNEDLEKKQLEASKARIVQYTNSLLENFKKLGPGGEAAAAIFSGMGEISFAVVDAFKVISDAGASTTEKIGAIAGAMSQVLGSVISIVNAVTNAKIAAVDREIKAEEKRDGKSAQSVARLEALDKKKDAMAKKQFELNKKLMIAQAVMSTAAGVAGALAATAYLGPFAAPALAALIGAMGAAQIALIASTQYESSLSARTAQPTSSLSIGRRDNSIDLARGPNFNAGGEAGFIRGSQGMGSNGSNFNTIGSAYGDELVRGYGKTGFVVGEKGPEILTPETPITVTPADKVGQSAPLSATFNIQALDASGVEQILVAQKGNIIKMLRDAANASGQGFLEDVNVDVYTRPAVNKL